MLPGRVAQVDDRSSWEKAIVLTPLPSQVRSTITRSVKADTFAERVSLPNRVWVRGRSLGFLVPRDFLGGHADTGWSYNVVGTGALLQACACMLSDHSS